MSGRCKHNKVKYKKAASIDIKNTYTCIIKATECVQEMGRAEDKVMPSELI